VFFFSLLLPVLAAAGGGAVAASTLQTGPRFQLRLLAPDPSRLHPIRGLGRLFSLEGAARGVFAVLKVAAAGWLLLRAIRSLVPGLHFPGGGTTSDTGLLAAACWSEAAGFGLRLGLAFLALALIDLAFQRWLHERGLRMTPAEVREEFHRLEGDPGVKERRRRAWRRLAESRQPRERQARRPDGAGDGRKPWRP
jgi:flagellar biosynthetic protein FlhB